MLIQNEVIDTACVTIQKNFTETLVIPIKRPVWSASIETAFKDPANLNKSKRAAVWKLHDLQNPDDAWTAKWWRHLLRLTAREVAHHFNARIAEFVQSLPMSRSVLQSYGYKTPSCIKSSVLPPNYKQGIGDKFKSNTADLYKAQKRPPYTKGDWSKINRSKDNPFVFKQIDGQYVIDDLDVPHFAMDKGFPVLLPHVNGKPHFAAFFLDVDSRMKDPAWNDDWSYPNKIQKLLNGELRSNCCEIVERDDKFFLHLVVSYSRQISSYSNDIVMGIDIGLKSPLFCVTSTGEKFSVSGNEFNSLKRHRNRKNLQVTQGRLSSRSKFAAIRILSKDNVRRDTAWINKIVNQSLLFARGAKTSKVQMEELESSMQSAKMIKFPYKRMQSTIENKCSENGIKVIWVKPNYTSQRCSKCGFINTEYNHKFRTDKKNWIRGRSPGFVCPDCGFGKRRYVDGDFNAASNLCVLDVDKLIQRQLKKQGIKTDYEITE